jgi:hypothetical protein
MRLKENDQKSEETERQSEAFQLVLTLIQEKNMFDDYDLPIEPIKLDKSKPSYSLSAGRSSSPANRFFWLTGPLASLATWVFFFAAVSSSSVVRRKRSNTRSVSIEARPEFCWVTTELAMLSLKRWRLQTE